jgi:hypothetical protein
MPPSVYPDAKIDEITGLLARGLTRSPRAPILGEVPVPTEALESRPTCLEVSGPTVLSVLTGYGFPRPKDGRQTCRSTIPSPAAEHQTGGNARLSI